MSDLSILAAAREAPNRVGLVYRDGALSFGDLARLVERQAEPGEGRARLTPRATPADIAQLLAHFERRAPFWLAHPRWADAELARATARVQRTPARELALLFTSGSSGRPKIVRLDHDAFAAAADAHARALPWQSDDRWVLTLPLAHVGGLSILTRALYARRPVVLAPDPFEPDALLSTIEEHSGTLLSLVPTMLARLADRPAPPTLRAVLLGGAAPPRTLVERARATGWPILPTYGASETCAQVCTQRLGEETPSGCGPPLPGVEIRIVERRIQVRGPTLMRGYLDDPNPIVDEWYPTGDVGSLDSSGHLHIEGRADDTIISGGENVDPREVEDALREHPRVDDVCVLGLPDDQWGQRIVAALSGQPIDDLAIRKFLEPRLARFKHPRRLLWLEALPRLSSGKVNRVALLGAFNVPLERFASSC